MQKSDIIEFFDRCAPTWDAEMVKSDRIIGMILDNAEVEAGQDILDVACGTGVMIPYYLEREVASVTGIDISPEMAKIATEKFAEEKRVSIICGDVETTKLEQKFDRIIVYNAFPHFPDPEGLIRVLASMLKEGGRLTVAHGASRERIDNHHKGPASKVSNGLMSAEKLKLLFAAYLDVEIMVSNSKMYQVSGVKQSGHHHDDHHSQEHAHIYIHEHSHDHDHPHDHTHDHEHEHFHDHGHPHIHDHGHTHDHASTGAPIDMLRALMKYTVDHNVAHARELIDLAGQIRTAGQEEAYETIMKAVEDYAAGNQKLDEVLKKL